MDRRGERANYVNRMNDAEEIMKKFTSISKHFWPAHLADPQGLEWPQVLNSLSVCLSVCLCVCLLVLCKFSNIISYDNII